MDDIMTHKLNKLVDWLMLYAEHLPTCKSWTHRHKQLIDKRARCEKAVCDCGLLELLTQLKPDIEYVTPCTDQDRGTLWGIPVVESDIVPASEVWLSSRDTGSIVRLKTSVPKTDETGIDS
jgi:hypothetical protein